MTLLFLLLAALVMAQVSICLWLFKLTKIFTLRNEEISDEIDQVNIRINLMKDFKKPKKKMAKKKKESDG